MNKINPKKLLNSKWMAVIPTKREKHFIVSKVEFNEEDMVASCCIEAAMSKCSIPVNWHDLKDDSHWVHGWK